MKEQLREDLATVPDLHSRTPPAPAPSAEEIAAAEVEAAGEHMTSPPPPDDQLDMFG
jgi:hypothetical protein